jgi:3-hydroxyisobutyrate dehydrogenase
MAIGFIGLGVMGEPMALNLARAGMSLLVWNRSPGAGEKLRAAGATVAATPMDLFAGSESVILMLANEQAMDQVLARGTPQFAQNVARRTIIHMGTTSPGYSRALEADILAAQGAYAEAPVSGSRKPAEDGALVAMLAGEKNSADKATTLIKPMCREIFSCGPVPNALLMKLAVNHFLISMVTGLAEAFHFAEAHGLDAEQLRAILDAGPMASAVSRIKAAKLASRDFAVQASIPDVLKNSRLAVNQAKAAGLASPLLSICERLYAEAWGLGEKNSDMVAVIRALEARRKPQLPETSTGDGSSGLSQR